MNHPLNNGTSVGAYTPPAMYTPRPGADSHKRFASLMTSGAALAAPVPTVAPVPTPTPMPGTQVQPPAPVAPGSAGYLPKAGSVAHRLCLMFLQHPGLSYTAADISRWFATKKDLVPNLLANSIDAGLLQRKRDCAEVFYSAGPAITRIESTLTDTKQKEPQVAITKQIPAKPAKAVGKKSPKNEDHSTPYKPQTVLTAVAPAVTETDEALRPYLQPVTLGASLMIVNDPLPTKRSEPYKYHKLFDSMAVGQAVRVPANDVGKVSAAMRKWIELTGKEDDLHVKSTPNYCDDTGYGRVWLLAGKSLMPKRKKKVA